MRISDKDKIDFTFFGTPHYSVYVLEELEKKGLLPALVVTAPDRPSGRGQKLTPPPAKEWAQKRGIPILQHQKLDGGFVKRLQDTRYTLQVAGCRLQMPLGIVAAYGNIIPESVVDIFPKGILNIHPSLLPKYRGASPVRSQILADDRNVGVTIMLIDKELDHGPILAQRRITPPYWPLQGSKLTELLFRQGGKLLADIIPKYTSGEIKPQEQDHNSATFTSKITKKDGLIDLNDDPYQNLLKIRAFDERPRTHFFTKDGMRVIITAAKIENGKLRIKKVIPEGRREMSWEEFEKTRLESKN